MAETSLDQWLTEGGSSLNGTIYGPPSIAVSWKNPGCPLVPRAFRRSSHAFANTITQLERLVKSDHLSVSDLDAKFLTRHGLRVLPRDIAATIRDDRQNLRYSPSDLAVPAGVPLEWVEELPIPIRARRSISRLIDARQGKSIQTSPVSIREFMDTRTVGFGTLYEMLCIIESAEVESDIEQPVGERFNKMNQIMSASRNASDDVENSHFRAHSALQDFASWATAENLGSTFGHAIRRIYCQGIDSEEWTALCRLPFDGLADIGKHPYVAIDEWLSGLSNRDTLIFMGRLNDKRHRKTLEELGRLLGLTRERIRQLESELKADLSTLVNRSRSIRWRSDTLRREIGVASPLPQVEHLLTPPVDYPDYRLILLENAGPFKVDGDWVVLESSVKSDPTKSLIASADRYGVIDVDTCTECLTHWGLDQSLHKPWLARNDEVFEFNCSLFRKPKSAPDRAAIALIDLGEPADVDKIIDHIGWDGNRGTMANGLGNDPRFIRVNQREWGLVDWGMQPYQTIADSIRNLLVDNGEPMSTSDVVDHLHERFGFVESSIASYFTAPAFVVEDGYIRLRSSEEEPYEYPASAIRRNRGVFKLADRRVALLMQIDNDMLRGSGRAMMQAVAEIVDLRVGETLEFSQSSGPGAKVYFNELSNSGPSLSSLQALVRNLSGRRGDYLVLVFDRDSMTVEPSLVKPSEIVQSWSAVGRLTGISPPRNLQALADSLECEEDEVYGILQSRRDEAVLSALPTV